MHLCPICGERANVVDSVSIEEGVYKRRKCKNGHISFSADKPVERSEARNAFYIAKKAYRPV